MDTATEQTQAVTPATPLKESLIKARNVFEQEYAMLEAYTAIAPGLSDWHVNSLGTGLRLIQLFPSDVLGTLNLHTQTSALAIFRALGMSVTVRGDGSMEGHKDGWNLTLHRAGAQFFIPAEADRLEGKA